VKTKKFRWARPIAVLAALAVVSSCGLPQAGPNKRQIFAGSVQNEGDAFVVSVNDRVTRATAVVPALGFLTVPLLADIEGRVTEDYGVWVEKNMYGKKSMGIERATYLIDANGKIAQIWRKVKVPGHVEAVLEAVRAL
tara:strand:+ start:1253 stop:1666 length:414 start_codon:yes stop_codon:yes gene_type:complete